MCYAPVGADELFEEMSDEDVSKLLRFLIKAGHHSAIEHAVYTFAIEGISRACTHQLVRHRLASYNQQSQRYVKFLDDFEYITPPAIRDDKAMNEVFCEYVDNAFELYKKMLASGIEAEDARYILPQAGETKIVVTMNARELLHFFELRCCDRAQWEIRELATAMLGLVKETAPVIFEKAGPGCMGGPCPEGKMTCGDPWPRDKE